MMLVLISFSYTARDKVPKNFRTQSYFFFVRNENFWWFFFLEIKWRGGCWWCGRGVKT